MAINLSQPSLQYLMKLYERKIERDDDDDGKTHEHHIPTINLFLFYLGC